MSHTAPAFFNRLLHSFTYVPLWTSPSEFASELHWPAHTNLDTSPTSFFVHFIFMRVQASTLNIKRAVRLTELVTAVIPINIVVVTGRKTHIDVWIYFYIILRIVLRLVEPNYFDCTVKIYFLNVFIGIKLSLYQYKMHQLNKTLPTGPLSVFFHAERGAGALSASAARIPTCVFLWDCREGEDHRSNQEQQQQLALRRWVPVQQAGDADGSWHWELGKDRETPSLNGRRFIGQENFYST